MYAYDGAVAHFVALDFDHILDGNRHTLKPAIIALDLYIRAHSNQSILIIVVDPNRCPS